MTYRNTFTSFNLLRNHIVLVVCTICFLQCSSNKTTKNFPPKSGRNNQKKKHPSSSKTRYQDTAVIDTLPVDSSFQKLHIKTIRKVKNGKRYQAIDNIEGKKFVPGEGGKLEQPISRMVDGEELKLDEFIGLRNNAEMFFGEYKNQNPTIG